MSPHTGSQIPGPARPGAVRSLSGASLPTPPNPPRSFLLQALPCVCGSQKQSLHGPAGSPCGILPSPAFGRAGEGPPVGCGRGPFTAAPAHLPEAGSGHGSITRPRVPGTRPVLCSEGLAGAWFRGPRRQGDPCARRVLAGASLHPSPQIWHFVSSLSFSRQPREQVSPPSSVCRN